MYTIPSRLVLSHWDMFMPKGASPWSINSSGSALSSRSRQVCPDDASQQNQPTFMRNIIEEVIRVKP